MSSIIEDIDLGHLTPEERQKILAVMKRLKDEEKKEMAMKKKVNVEYKDYQEHVKKATGNANQPNSISKLMPKGTNDMGQVCALCHNTKIVDGCGHTCSYCSMQFCSRCGGRVSVVSSKNERMIMWVCNLCRKQQEMLTKSGTLYRNCQNESSLTLNLEPVPSFERARGKMSGSASLAQLEFTKPDRGMRSRSGVSSPRLKKGMSEPQLANCEKDTVPSVKVVEYPNGKTSKPLAESSVITSSASSVPADETPESRSMHGVRRSSTNSERRLYRQDQTIAQDPSSPKKVASSFEADGTTTFTRPQEVSKRGHEQGEDFKLPHQDNANDRATCSVKAKDSNQTNMDVEKTNNEPNLSLRCFSLLSLTHPRETQLHQKEVSNTHPDAKPQKIQSNTLANSKAGNSHISKVSTVAVNNRDLVSSPQTSKSDSNISMGSSEKSIHNVRRNSHEKIRHVNANPNTVRSKSGQISNQGSSKRQPRKSTMNNVNRMTRDQANHISSNLKKSNSNLDETRYSLTVHGEETKSSSQAMKIPCDSAQLTHSYHPDSTCSPLLSNKSSSHKSASRSNLTQEKNHTISKDLHSNSKAEMYQSPKKIRCSNVNKFRSRQDHGCNSMPRKKNHNFRRHQRCAMSDNEGSNNSNSYYRGPRSSYGSQNAINVLDDSPDSVNSDTVRKTTGCNNTKMQRCNNNLHRDCNSGVRYFCVGCTTPNSRAMCTSNHSHQINEHKNFPVDYHTYYTDSNQSRSHTTCHKNYRRHDGSPRCVSAHSQGSALRKTYAKQNSRAGKHLRRKPSLSSTDEDILSTPEYSSGDEIEKRMESSGKGQNNLQPCSLLFISSPFHGKLNQAAAQTLKKQEQLFQHKPKSIHHNAFMNSPYNATKHKLKRILSKHKTVPGHDTDAKSDRKCNLNPDSCEHCPGITTNIDVGSSMDFTCQQPVMWQPSSDGKFLIGKMTLNKELTSLQPEQMENGGVLGLKVVGGKVTESGHLGAFITKVKKGSLADVIGNLKSGDEVLKWNQHCLRDATFDEVYEAVLASKKKKVVELVVSRPTQDESRNPESFSVRRVTESSSSSFDSQKREDNIVKGSSSYATPQQHPAFSNKQSTALVVCGRLQVRVWYQQASQQLHVTLVQAADLIARPDGNHRNPYIKMYLLPDRSASSRMRSRIAKKTLDPHWNQSFVYEPIRRQDLDSMTLELTMWDFDRCLGSSNCFLGEVLLDLGLSQLDDVPRWFSLQPAKNENNMSFSLTAKQAMQNCAHTVSRHTMSSLPHLTSDYDNHGNAPNGYVISDQPNSTLTISPRQIDSATNTRHQDHASFCHVATSLCSSPSSMEASSRHDCAFGGMRVLPSPPGGKMRSSKTEIIQPHSGSDQFQSSEFDATHKTRSRHHSSDYSPQLNCCTFPKDSVQRENEPHLFHQQTKESQRTHSTVLSSHSSQPELQQDSQQSTEYVDGSDDLQLNQNKLSKSNKKTAKALSSSQQRKEYMSKSLSANLHTQDKNNSQSKMTVSSSGRNTPQSRTNSVERKTSARKTNSLGQKITSVVGITGRSQSSSTLGCQHKAGNSPRCSEYGIHPRLTRNGSKESPSGSIPSIASEGSSSVDKTLQNFVGGLGPGQVVGRQTLAASSLGDLELGFYERRGQLEVQVIRARNLVPKANTKILPATYVKVYLLFDLQCISKKKTKIARRALDPAFHQTLTFDPTQYGNAVQVIMWGDYGRMDHKAFMGVIQVRLDSLNLSTNSIGWYHLFPTTSLIDASSLEGTHPGSMTSLDSDMSSVFKS
ncbi:regulating synaptic membrane exocytosis protein 2-like isoform X3 [Clavelina lepadiformis]|uniref:regulating synaptic membrane exocytosis protein 2-like isoform X3 n=1 Tax=Clavelina lepadiformis TaxID=159417 RepID=UPI004041C849